jgi:hypothetical protein
MKNYHTAAGMESVFLPRRLAPLDLGQGALDGSGLLCKSFLYPTTKCRPGADRETRGEFMNKVIPCILFLLITTSAHAFQCNECHSKNPAMVRMHKAVQGRDCFGCHKIGEKLMGKGIPKDKTTQLKRRVSDPLCVECHKK